MNSISPTAEKYAPKNKVLSKPWTFIGFRNPAVGENPSAIDGILQVSTVKELHVHCFFINHASCYLILFIPPFAEAYF